MRTLILSAVALLATTTAAMAQNPPSRLPQLHDALHLDAQQEAAWRDYVRAVTPSQRSLSRREAAQEMLPRLPTPRRIALLDATMNQDIADFQKQGDEVVSFYNQLTPQQQRIFDRQTAPAEQQR